MFRSLNGGAGPGIGESFARFPAKLADTAVDTDSPKQRRELTAIGARPILMRLFISLVLIVLAVMFAVQNAEVVPVSVLFWDFRASLAIVVVISCVVGALVCAIAFLPALYQRSSALRALRRRQKELETDNADLLQRVPLAREDDFPLGAIDDELTPRRDSRITQ